MKSTIAGLSLSDEQLDTDEVSVRIRSLKESISILERETGGAEPWLIEWLSDEHYKGAILYGAAVANKRKMPPFNTPGTQIVGRAEIVRRFNQWVETLNLRIDAYEVIPASGTVTPWLGKLAAFKIDPLNQP